MSIPINIENLIRQSVVESSRIEYKSDWNPEPIIHTIAAFANDIDNLGGGYIIIGIEEQNGHPRFPIKGIQKNSIDFIQKELLNKCNLIEPRYIPIVENTIFEGKDVLVLWVPGGEDRPYKCPAKISSDKNVVKSEKVYYIRKASNTIKANVLEERELIGLAHNIPFDDRINNNAQVEDIRSSLISEFLYKVESELYKESLSRTVEDVATDMKIVGGAPENKKPVNVGLMFFNERPDNFFPYSRIEVVDKPDPTGIDMKEKIFTGPLDKQLQDALAYIKNYVIAEYITKVPDQAEAVRIFNWPFRAIEEALSNAIYHRSYQIHEPITVTIMPDKLEILSLPGPDRSITDEDLKNRVLVSGRYRNRRIGDFLKELKLVEGRNTGIPLILKEMKQNGSEPPIFKTDEERTYFRLILPIHPDFFGKSKDIIKMPEGGQKKNKRRGRNELQRLIIEVITEKESISMNELATELGYKSLNNTLRAAVKQMLDDKRIEYLYPDKPHSRNQRLRLSNDKEAVKKASNKINMSM